MRENSEVRALLGMEDLEKLEKSGNYSKYIVKAVSYNNMYDKKVTSEVGVGGVERIFYHESKGEGDEHYCDIVSRVGKGVNVHRVFKPSSIEFKEEEEGRD